MNSMEFFPNIDEIAGIARRRARRGRGRASPALHVIGSAHPFGEVAGIGDQKISLVPTVDHLDRKPVEVVDDLIVMPRRHDSDVHRTGVPVRLTKEMPTTHHPASQKNMVRDSIVVEISGHPWRCLGLSKTYGWLAGT